MEQSQLTPAQIEVIRQQRTQRFKSMGLPATAGQLADMPIENMPTQRVAVAPTPVVEEQVRPQQYVQSKYAQQQVQQPQYAQQEQKVAGIEMENGANIAQQIQIQLAEEKQQSQAAMYTAPRDRYSALEAIKRGAKKQEIGVFIKAETKGVKGEQLPEPKVGKRKPVRPGQPQEKPKVSIALEGTRASRNAEADALENMFTDKASGISMRSTSGVPQGNLITEDYSSIGPTFDPVAHLKKKAADKGVMLDLPSQRQQPQQNQVFQQASNNDFMLNQMMLMMETMMKNNQKSGSYDLESLKPMIEATAKKVAEDTIRRVLKEYADNQKKKNVYEVVNQEKKVVRIGDKLYKLTPVTIKSQL